MRERALVPCRALRVTPRFAAHHLDALDRMAQLFRREMDGLTTPRARLAVLHRRLLPHHTVSTSLIESGPSSFLPRVLRDRAGNCLGLTSLYLALGERLDLPLVPVTLPEHVFIRWEDGKTVFDIELTDGGRRRSEMEPQETTPRVLTSKGLVSLAFSNLAGIYLSSPSIRDDAREDGALHFAHEALAYDPANDAAHLARAQALSRLGDTAGALAAARRALALAPSSLRALLVAGESLLRDGRYEEALDFFDRARARDPEEADALLGRLACLARLHRDEDLISEATAFLQTHDHDRIRLIRLHAMVRLDRPGWEAEIDRLHRDRWHRWTLRLSLARALLDHGAATDALAVLRPLDDLEREAAKVRDASPDHSRFVAGTGDEDGQLIRNADLQRLGRQLQACREEATRRAAPRSGGGDRPPGRGD